MGSWRSTTERLTIFQLVELQRLVGETLRQKLHEKREKVPDDFKW